MSTVSKMATSSLYSMVVFLLFVNTSLAQPNFLFRSCSANVGNYTDNNPFQINLNTALSSLVPSASDKRGFNSVSSGQGADRVNLIALCRGDIPLDLCSSCLIDSAREITRQCPYHKEAIGVYDNCMIRYSNRSIFSTVDDYVTFFMWNTGNVSNPVTFNLVLATLLHDLRARAASSLVKFAVGQAQTASLQNVYAMVQCTPDLSVSQCSSCLEQNINRIPQCCAGRAGGRVIAPSCALRFELYRFYNQFLSHG